MPPDDVMNAQATVSKMEVAIATMGYSDPTCATLREALARAKSEAQERSVADRIKHTNIFIEGEEEGPCVQGKCEDGSGGGGGRLATEAMVRDTLVLPDSAVNASSVTSSKPSSSR